MAAVQTNGHGATNGKAGATIEEKLRSALKRLETLEAKNEITELHYKYGYYLDKCLYEQVVDLFANNDQARIHFHGGIWRGKESIKRIYIGRFQGNFTGGRNGPVYGFLLDHPMYQPIVTVSEDGNSAKMRIRCNMQAGLHVKAMHDDPGHRDYRERAWMEGALYENDYVRENGIWKIQVLKYRPQWHANWTEGIAYTPEEFVPFVKALKRPENPTGPDEIEKVTLWPETHVLPFHYPDANGNWLKPEEIQCARKVYKQGSNGRIA